MTKYLTTALALGLSAWISGKPDAPAELKLTLNGHTNSVLSLAFSRDGKHLATGSQDNAAKVWEVASGDEEASFDVKYSVTGVAFSPDARLLFTGSWGGQVWEIDSGIRQRHFESHTGFVTCIGTAKDGKRLITGSLDGSAKVFDLESGQEIWSLEHGGQVNCLAVSRDGKRLATGGDTRIKTWDLSSGKETESFEAELVNGLVFGTDSDTLFSAHGDKIVRQWDLKTGKVTGALKGHTDKVLSLAISPDGKTLLSGGADHTVRFWKLPAGEEAGVLNAHDGTVNAVSLSPDGKLIATAGSDKLVKLWRLMH